MKSNVVLEARDLSHAYGSNQVLHRLKLEIDAGQIVGLVGPSGCGKSTLLRTIVGTLKPTRGGIYMYSGSYPEDGVPVQRPGRDRGIVYQRYSLYPQLTARENVALGLCLETPIWRQALNPLAWRKRKQGLLERAETLLDKLQLGDASLRYPHELSGGMQQRVSIAQALIMQPRILLLDEPFGALDEATREALQRMLLTLYQENQTAKAEGQPAPYTILIVTHELNEAIFVGDRVVGLSQYWDWRSEGFEACPGATIVYDDHAPVFDPDDDREPHLYKEQKLEILRTVFDPETMQARQGFVRYWSTIHGS